LQPKTFSEQIQKLVMDSPDGCPTERICKTLGRTPQDLGSAFEFLKTRRVINGYAGVWLAPTFYEEISGRLEAAIAAQHEKEPNRAWFRPEAIAKQANLRWTGKPLDRLFAQMEDEGRIAISEQGIRLRNAKLDLSMKQGSLLDRVLQILEAEPVNTPTPFLIGKSLGLPHHAVDEVLKLGLLSGQVVQIDEVVFYTPKQLVNIQQKLKTWYGSAPFAMTDFRDKLGTTRKYAVPLLDYFDSIGFTRGNNNQRRVL